MKKTSTVTDNYFRITAPFQPIKTYGFDGKDLDAVSAAYEAAKATAAAYFDTMRGRVNPHLFVYSRVPLSGPWDDVATITPAT